jgi:choline dehydrogenase-like flavoprotein
VLTIGARRTLDAAVRRIVLTPPDDLTDRVEDRIAGLAEHKRTDVESGLRLFGGLPAAMISVRRAVPFHALNPAQQDRMLDAWNSSPLPQARTLFQLLRRLTLLVHYSDPRSHERLGYRGPLHSREPAFAWEGPAPELATPVAHDSEPVLRGSTFTRTPERRPLPSGVITAANFTGPAALRAEAVIIGSGAGGAVAAARLAVAGKSVIILEAGAFLRSEEFTEEEGPMAARLFAERGLRSTDDLAVSLLQGAAVGGSTTVNWMIMLRTPEHVLDEWSRRFGLDGMGAAAMAPVFAQIEAEVHARRVPDDAHSPNNRIVLDGAARLGWRAHSAVINARGCVRSGFCSQGCRYDAKQGTQQVYLPLALQHGATLYADTHATSIEVIATVHGDRARMPTKRVTAIMRAPGEDGKPRTITIETPIVIVSGGAVESPLLLQRSGLGGGGVGRFLRLHPTTAVIGVHDQVIYGAAGIPLSTMCDEFIQRDANGYGFWLECPPLHPAVGATAISGFGEQHAALMRQFPHLASTIALVRDGSDADRSTGSVLLDARGRTRIRYALSPADAANMRAAIEAAARLQLAAGAREVHTLHHKPLIVRSEADLHTIRTRAVDGNRLSVFSAHVNGTCRIGTDPASSGVGPSGERHGARGVFVFDGSMLPTGVGVNPQETIMAMTSVLTERLIAHWPA